MPCANPPLSQCFMTQLSQSFEVLPYMSKALLSLLVIYLHVLRTPPWCCNSSLTHLQAHQKKKKSPTWDTWYLGLVKEFRNQSLQSHRLGLPHSTDLALPPHQPKFCQRFKLVKAFPSSHLTKHSCLQRTMLDLLRVYSAPQALPSSCPTEKQQVYLPHLFPCVKAKWKKWKLNK